MWIDGDEICTTRKPVKQNEILTIKKDSKMTLGKQQWDHKKKKRKILEKNFSRGRQEEAPKRAKD